MTSAVFMPLSRPIIQRPNNLYHLGLESFSFSEEIRKNMS